MITQNQSGGVIRLVGDQGKAMEDANKQMAQHCGPGNYQITQKGEEAIGKDTFSNSNTQYGEDTVAGGASTTDGTNTQAVGASSTRGGAQQNGVVSERTAVEIRVHYVCGGAAGAPPPPPPPPM
jgi:hypothetical protein